jgi:glyoxylase-like metal-dependent hydrolase (beta-lactamase superfamily II)
MFDFADAGVVARAARPVLSGSGLGALVLAVSGLLVSGQPVQAQPTAMSPQAAQQASPVVNVKAERVSASAWYVQGLSAMGSSANQNFISNAGFVVTPEGVVVIDALGSPALAERLLAEIRRVTPLPVTHVIVTHYHADHIYGLQVFKAQGAQIWAQVAAREYLQSDAARLRMEISRQELAPWIDENTRLVPPDQWISGRTELVVGGRRLVLEPVGPSHTPEDLVVYLPDEKVLFAGDLVFRSRIPFVGQADSGHWVDSLKTLQSLDVAVVVPGHGPLSTEAAKDLALTRDYLVYLRSSMAEAAQNMEPFDSAYESADWSRFEHLPLFKAVNRMNAYNTYLLMEQQAK